MRQPLKDLSPPMQTCVLIPTRNRPRELQVSLASVLAQDESLLGQIIVSDNSDNDDTAAVIAGFKHPALRYERLAPVIHDPIERTRRLYAQSRCAYTAILHDDDWWHPDHLRQSLQAMQEHPQAGLCGSSHLIWDEASSGNRLENPAIEILHAMHNTRACLDRMLIKGDELLICAALGAFVHYSTMVMTRRFLDRIEDILLPGLFVFDTDRLHFLLARDVGGVVINVAPSATVRVHAAQESARLQGDSLQLCRPVSQRVWELISAANPSEIVGRIGGLYERAMNRPDGDLFHALVHLTHWIPLAPELEVQIPQRRQLLELDACRRSRRRRWIHRARQLLGPLTQRS
jgi:hypothetical protein